MKIGEIDVADDLMMEALKRSGKRVVDNTDYEGKASAANDLSKFRSMIGDDRPIDELAKAFAEMKKLELSQKTKEELLTMKAKDLEKAIQERDALLAKVGRDIKVRQVKDAFKELMDKENVKVIEPILEKYRSPLYDADLSKMTADEIKAQSEEAIRQAYAEQQKELGNLGIKVEAPVTPSFSDGGQVFPGVAPKGGGEIFEILKQTSSSAGLGVSLGLVPKK